MRQLRKTFDTEYNLDPVYRQMARRSASLRKRLNLNMQEASALASCIDDERERALIGQVIRTHAEGGKQPGWASMSPLMRVASNILDGYGDGFWLGQARRRAGDGKEGRV